MGVLAVAVVVAIVVGARVQRTVLDDVIDDPLAGLDETPHVWTDEHGDGYDPEQQNVWAEDGAFDPPFVGYAKKDLKWRAPAEPETNALDYLPSVPALHSGNLPATYSAMWCCAWASCACSHSDKRQPRRGNSRSRNRWNSAPCLGRTLPPQMCGPRVSHWTINFIR